MTDSLSQKKDSLSFSLLCSHKPLPLQDALNIEKNDSLTYLTLKNISGGFKKEHPKRESIFTHHYLFVKSDIKPLDKQQESEAWIFGILVGISILFCWIFRSYHVRTLQMFKACFTNRHMNMLMKDGNILKESVLPAIALIYLPIISLFIYKFCKEYSFCLLSEMHNYIAYILIVGGLSILTLLKFLIIQFIGNIFKSISISTIYLVNDIVFDLLMTIILFPLLFLMFFTHINLPFQLTTIALAIIVIIYIIKIIRGFTLTLTVSKFSKLYLFYYLCSIEILPLLVVGKILFSYTR